jgi:ABC-type polysaccharide/polyol phosphate export permease
MQIANESPIAFRSSATRPGALTLVLTAAREVWSRRRLIGYMVRAEVKKKGANTVLGNLWWVIDPLLAAGVYVIVMSLIFARSIPDFALFLLAALVPYKWFTATIGDTTSSVRTQVSLIKQIQFPKIVLPIVSAGAEVVNFAFAMLVLVVIMVIGAATNVLDNHLSLMLLWVPVIAAIQFVFSLGIATMLSAVTVFYKDVGIFVGHLMRLLFWVSPILWTFDLLDTGRGAALHEALGDVGMSVLQFNPIAILLNSYRHVIYGQLAINKNGEDVWTAPIAPDLVLLGIVLVIGIVVCILGTWVFKRLEPSFAKVL